MKIGFSKDGLTFNSKKFHPLNLPLKGISLESDIPLNPTSATEILTAFQEVKPENASKSEKIQLLKSMVDKTTI
ncbi:hypothetical protein [Anaerosalibacter massiliensis]|uniref:Uncharacterized protein n=1 Tax=Anaerosalibacter massiliensis TaxID=1347392 RepID=A0A9X2MFS1_9FIRM|nr:hypothetical protein [Anaerosalibacter massiliensis]MCR2042849.1 hypothetical protein [Anaerosalibacter massiliensis]